MKDMWKEFSKEATVEEVMLDSTAQLLTKHELPEIMALVPSLEGLTVLELGAGIGRYTRQLAKMARHVTAVDFTAKFVNKNREENGHHDNVDIIQADVTVLDYPNDSFDLIFSNWLLMYLTDEELLSLTERMLSWLRPGGYLFFRESCFHKSGDIKVASNHTNYRTPAVYNDLMMSVVWEEPEPGRWVYRFDVTLTKAVETYIKVRKAHCYTDPNGACS
ncbi:PEAM3 methyltransferase, partial [Amia calva]|nr:PEAM3 methyltransferase [Amia calva]